MTNEELALLPPEQRYRELIKMVDTGRVKICITLLPDQDHPGKSRETVEISPVAGTLEVDRVMTFMRAYQEKYIASDVMLRLATDYIIDAIRAVRANDLRPEWWQNWAERAAQITASGRTK